MLEQRRLPRRRGQPDDWHAVTPWASLDDDVSPVAVRAHAQVVQILLRHVHSEKQGCDEPKIQN